MPIARTVVASGIGSIGRATATGLGPTDASGVAVSVIEDLDRAASDTVIGWAATVRAIWRNTCAWEGLDPATPFVTFRPDNPHVPFLDRALARLREEQANRAAFGYVGLVIG